MDVRRAKIKSKSNYNMNPSIFCRVSAAFRDVDYALRSNKSHLFRALPLSLFLYRGPVARFVNFTESIDQIGMRTSSHNVRRTQVCKKL